LPRVQIRASSSAPARPAGIAPLDGACRKDFGSRLPILARCHLFQHHQSNHTTYLHVLAAQVDGQQGARDRGCERRQRQRGGERGRRAAHGCGGSRQAGVKRKERGRRWPVATFWGVRLSPARGKKREESGGFKKKKKTRSTDVDDTTCSPVHFSPMIVTAPHARAHQHVFKRVFSNQVKRKHYCKER
jgi:hypothetical protein